MLELDKVGFPKTLQGSRLKINSRQALSCGMKFATGSIIIFKPVLKTEKV